MRKGSRLRGYMAILNPSSKKRPVFVYSTRPADEYMFRLVYTGGPKQYWRYFDGGYVEHTGE